MTISFYKENRGITALLFTILVLLLFYFFAGLANVWYQNFFFQLFRFVWDHSIGLIPIPFIYVLILFLPILLYLYWRSFKGVSYRWLYFMLNLVSWVIVLFFWMWGFNYSCQSKVKISKEELTTSELWIMADSIALKLKSETNPLAQMEFDQTLIDSSLRVVIRDQGIRTWGSPIAFQIGHHGLMRRLGIAGIYLPFAGEAHIDGSYLGLQRTFITAHELSHAYGISGEAEADYFAFLALKRMSDQNGAPTKYTYAAWFELLRSVRRQLLMIDEKFKEKLDSSLTWNVLHDLQSARDNAKLYPEFFPGSQEKMNNTYLKMMGVDAGVKDYDRFILMVWDDAFER